VPGETEWGQFAIYTVNDRQANMKELDGSRNCQKGAKEKKRLARKNRSAGKSRGKLFFEGRVGVGKESPSKKGSAEKRAKG